MRVVTSGTGFQATPALCVKYAGSKNFETPVAVPLLSYVNPSANCVRNVADTYGLTVVPNL